MQLVSVVGTRPALVRELIDFVFFLLALDGFDVGEHLPLCEVRGEFLAFKRVEVETSECDELGGGDMAGKEKWYLPMVSELGEIGAEALQRLVIEAELAPVEAGGEVVAEEFVVLEFLIKQARKLLGVLELGSCRLHPEAVRHPEVLLAAASTGVDGALVHVISLDGPGDLPIEDQLEAELLGELVCCG